MGNIFNKLKKAFPKKINLGLNPTLETKKAIINMNDNRKITLNFFGESISPKQIKKVFEENQILTREDLLLFEAKEAEIIITRSQLLKQYRFFLSEKDLAALSDSLSIIDLEDNGLNNEALKRNDQLHKAFKERGAAIYNFTRSGLFETEIKNVLDGIIKEKGLGIEAKDEFSNYFEGLIKNHPTNIYVGRGTDQKKLIDELQKKIIPLNKGEINIIKLYFREPQATLTNSLKPDIEHIFKLEEKLVKFGKNIAFIWYLTKKESTP